MVDGVRVTVSVDMAATVVDIDGITVDVDMVAVVVVGVVV